jgi:hypothetical protein
MGADYWYVRARNLQTGEEIQRIAAPESDRDGLASASTASDDMKRYLLRIGLATEDGGLGLWEIVDVHRAA